MIYRILGIMTGNSNDAMDLVLTEFNKDLMQDIASYTVPYDVDFQKKMQKLRDQVHHKKRAEILKMPLFQEVHDAYMTRLAVAVQDFLEDSHVPRDSVQAIGFHGKTLDHYPPSQAKKNGDIPYTLQMGSGQRLADLTQIPVVYDFRSAPIKAGLEGAPLIPLHTLHIAKKEGNGCYFNGGNTANFSWIQNEKILASSDTGPFNAYVDAFVQQAGYGSFDEDGKLGMKGTVREDLLLALFQADEAFYTAPLPKSGDPQYYHQDVVFERLQGIKFPDALRTLEYLAAYTALYGLSLMPGTSPLLGQFYLFGGGWKNPLIEKDFTDLLTGKRTPLPGHEKQINAFLARLDDVNVQYSPFGQMMEARLMADMAYFFLRQRPWIFQTADGLEKKILCGRLARPKGTIQGDELNQAALE